MNLTFDTVIKGKTLDIDLRHAGPGNESLNTLCTDLFLIVMNITTDVDMGTEEDIRQILKYYVDQFMENCNAVGIDPKKRDYVKYALVALIDEKVLNLPEWSGPWSSHMLQLDYFGDMVAGERFFEHLDLLMKNPGNFHDVLEIYYLCLCLGFKGKHLAFPDKLQSIISHLPKMIFTARAPMDKLSVNTPKVNVHSRRTVPHIPTWLIGAVTALLISGIWIGLVIASGNLSRKTLPDIEKQHEPNSILNYKAVSDLSMV